MTKSYRTYVASLPLLQALWWFIENDTPQVTDRQEIFFDLRERVRGHADAEGKLVKAANSLISDVETMQADTRSKTDSFDEGFGPFSEYVMDGDHEMYVEWPNLDTSIQKLKQAVAAIPKAPGITGAKAELIITDEIDAIRVHGSERDLDFNG